MQCLVPGDFQNRSSFLAHTFFFLTKQRLLIRMSLIFYKIRQSIVMMRSILILSRRQFEQVFFQVLKSVVVGSTGKNLSQMLDPKDVYNSSKQMRMFEQNWTYCLVPVHDVVFARTTVVEPFCMMHIKDRREIDQLLSYVVKTYIGLINSRTGNSPLFAIEMWNIYDRILNDKHTTNNAVWNVGIKLLVPTTISSE